MIGASQVIMNVKQRFTEEEKRYPLLFITKFKNMFETKEKYSVSCKKKTKAWHKITSLFNNETGFNMVSYLGL